ncbi:MAG: PTS sugar transporter subunit IIA [Chitinispirillaceae bacterium]|nr:PTS sugar transporter subunit IIA [Chitinispirillaceae bacterium]
MKLRDVLSHNSILIDVHGTEKVEVLSQMTGYMVSLYDLPDPPFIKNKILDREAEMSTGIGFGIAIPHARIPQIDRIYMIAGRSTAGVDFNAIDEHLVHLIFMMISPANTSTDHTALLSSLSRIMSYEDMRRKLLSAPSAEQFLDLLIKGEDKYVE